MTDWYGCALVGILTTRRPFEKEEDLQYTSDKINSNRNVRVKYHEVCYNFSFPPYIWKILSMVELMGQARKRDLQPKEANECIEQFIFVES